MRTMLCYSNYVLPSLARKSNLVSLFAYLQNHNFRSISEKRPPISENRRSFCALASFSPSPSPSRASAPSRSSTKAARRKAQRESPEGVLRHGLDMCSKRGDLSTALQLYDEARLNGVSLTQHHYNALLYLCSSVDSDEEDPTLGLRIERGFEIFSQMASDRVDPNEATITSAARLAAAAGDPEKAFDLVKLMKKSGIPPKLRSYGPALFGFCRKLDARRAYEVDAHMVESGVEPEEAELAALIEVSAAAEDGAKVYETLQRLRAAVRQVSEQTAAVVERWFQSEAASRVGSERWDEEAVRDRAVAGGGGWHGMGWLGSGRWEVTRTQMDQNGVCQCCNERLVCIDIDLNETADFATSLASLASNKESRSDFVGFQKWLERHGPFDAVVDGANIGLIRQRSFDFFQLKSVVHLLREISPSKRMPLIILHNRRVQTGPAQNPKNMQLLESWKKSGSLYSTPSGSNDDWYWLYAAVSSNCLLVTNDEMRDHLFQLLGNGFFPRWKEKHQVRVSILTKGPILHMPPPYSIVIQESENGRWHVPTVTGDDIEAPRQWLCATRASNTK